MLNADKFGSMLKKKFPTFSRGELRCVIRCLIFNGTATVCTVATLNVNSIVSTPHNKGQ